ncbi:hypothetical protein CAP39_14845 [Sphingomonas sp. IBVSS1]|nr:hypothetical protein CAP39_14845 [Sphingomonas sp. IBVSS1]
MWPGRISNRAVIVFWPPWRSDGVNQVSMALASRTAVMRRSTRIMAPYNRLEFRPWFPVFKLVLICLMMAMIVYGSALATVGGTQVLKTVSLPILGLLGVVIWLLPDADTHSRGETVDLPFLPVLLTFIASIIVWPSYIAIVIPGLPWITPPRLILAVLLAMMLIYYPQRGRVRSQIVDTLGYDRIAISLFLLYECLNFIVLPLSPGPAETASYWALQDVMNFSAVIGAAAFLHNPKNFKPIYAVVTCVAIYSMLVAVLENYMQIPPWAENIPSFMRIDEDWLARILSPQARIGDTRYRIRSTFPVVLYYTLYLSLVMPMVLYAMTRMTGRFRILGLGLIVLVLHTAWFANARTAIIALIVPLVCFSVMTVARSIANGSRRDALKFGIRGMMVLMAVGMLGGVLATSHRAQMYVFGGKQHAGSNLAREKQWANAWAQLAKNPVGVGLGNSIEIVGVDVRGKKIVDSLYINMLVDLGYLGFIAYFGMFLRCAWLGVRCFLRAANEYEEYAGAAAVGLIGYTINCSVVSNTDSAYLAFLFCGLIIATKRHQDRRITEEAKNVGKGESTALAPVRR